jgi:hypothetical protein
VRLLRAVACALGTLAFLAPAASAADSVYWAAGGAGSVRVGNLDGSGSAANVITGLTGPLAVAVNPAAGKIYASDNNRIRVANLNGTGLSDLFTGVLAYNVAIDAVAGKIYFADSSGGKIQVGNLNGSGSPTTLFSGEGDVHGVAIDPAAGKIYWASFASSSIRVGNINGTGSPTNLFSDANNPVDVAVDSAAGKIYWSDFNGGAINVGNANGTGSPSVLFPGGGSSWGVAIDPGAGKIYWSDSSNGIIHAGDLNGTGSASSLFTGENGPRTLSLLRSPVGAGTPLITGGSTIGSALVCSQGSWATDLVGAFLYRAPRSFTYQWSLAGAPIHGPASASSTYTPTAPGSYSCRVTATNQAGSTSQTSAPLTVTSVTATISKAKISSKHHSAKFTFTAPSATGFQCALVKKPKGKHGKHKPKPKYHSCNSPKTYKHLKRGRYTFFVRPLISGIAGTPASKNFKIT